MALDFPATPGVGDTYTSGGVVWVWDGSKWLPNGLAVAYLPLTGGTLTGGLIAPSVTTNQLIAPQAIGDNRIINGDMRIDQRNGTGRSTNTSSYPCDRWWYGASQTGVMQWAQGAAAQGSINPAWWLGMLSLGAYTPVANDWFQVGQVIEADMVSDLMWGSSQAQPVTLSALVLSTLTGLFGGVICGSGSNNRAYPFTYTIPVANVWTPISITIPGDTSGPWVMNGNGAAFWVIFDLGSGSNWRAPAGAWASSGANGATGTINVCETNGAQWDVTNVKLEIGIQATPFNRQSLAKSLADCQRYYERSGDPGYGFGTVQGSNFLYVSPTGGESAGSTTYYKVTKRTAATLTIYSASTGAANMVYDQNNGMDIPATIFYNGLNSFGWYAASQGANGINFACSWTANADFT